MDEQRISPVPMPKQEPKGEFIVLAKENIGRTFQTFVEAERIAREAAVEFGKDMLIFQLAGGFLAEIEVKKISLGKTVG